MEPTIFRFVWKYSWRQQLVILGLTVGTFPVLYATLELPKLIVNRALAGGVDVYELYGVALDQTGYLFVLCGAFLLLVSVAGALKYLLNVYAGIVAERMLRRLRYQLYSQILRFPLPYFRKLSQGELVQMINAEVEPLGGFVGEAFATPAFQGGTLLTILAFVFVQDWLLGLAAIALYPLQAYIIPKLQRQVNELGKQRVQQVRRNAEKIGETASGIVDVHANDTSLFERARFSDQLAAVFSIRFQIYKKKFLIKFINNFMAQLGPFFFFTIGGYFVIQGELTLGALVAVLNAHKDLSAPWKELLTWYQTMYDVKIKYEQVVAQFVPPGLKDLRLLDADPPEDAPEFSRELRAIQLVLEDEGTMLLDGVEFALDLPLRVAVLGGAGSGRHALGLVAAGLLPPTSGRLLMDGRNLHELPESVLGRRIGYVGNPSHIFRGTIEANLLYGLLHRPVRSRPPDPELERYLREARRSGNLPLDPAADWVDDAQAGIPDPQARFARVRRVLALVRLEEDVYGFGLRGRIAAQAEPQLARALLEARQSMLRRLARDPALARLVEPFDPARYNSNATVAENLLFGTPADGRIDLDRLAEHPYVREVLERTGLLKPLLDVGRRLAETMLELFSELPPDHEYFRQFSFIDPERLPEYRALLQRIDPAALPRLPRADQDRLLALALRLVAARHRLGLIDGPIQDDVVAARRWLREHLPADLQGAVTFFDPHAYNDALPLQENVLFGKVAWGQGQALERVTALVRELLEEMGLHDQVLRVGLGFECGVGGSRLALAQRQKLALAREVMKRPALLVLDNALAALDPADQEAIREALFAEFDGRSLLWILASPEWSPHFDRVIVMEHGRIAAIGRFDQLGPPGGAGAVVVHAD
ncbi:Putative multidrug export ATP-binding/permease protein [bacterium HR40]|nr:Putative multidrug export ATP-binding/permease protein [bacterium HR40]